ncbi:6002_t:CDS:2, partial [Diversispora eburnea]
YWITDKTVSRILNSCSNLRCLGIPYSRGKIKDASILVQTHLKLEYLDFTSVMAFQNDSLIVAIIRSSPNLKRFNISHNDIGDESDSESEFDTFDSYTSDLDSDTSDSDSNENNEENPDENSFISAFSNYISVLSDLI